MSANPRKHRSSVQLTHISGAEGEEETEITQQEKWELSRTDCMFGGGLGTNRFHRIALAPECTLFEREKRHDEGIPAGCSTSFTVCYSCRC